MQFEKGCEQQTLEQLWRNQGSTKTNFSDPRFGVDALCMSPHAWNCWLDYQESLTFKMKYLLLPLYNIVYWGVKNMFHSSSNNTLHSIYYILWRFGRDYKAMNVAEKEPKQIPFSICHETLKNCHNKASSNLAWMAKNDSPPFQLSIKTGFGLWEMLQ